jgi:eukaryotic-like serine/threonine-protein kinase
VNGQDSNAEIFDVFLCHNSEDKPAVREVAQKLSQENIKPWLDEADIRTGSDWHAVIGEQIQTVKSAAVFFGSHGVNNWQSREIIALLNQSDRRGCPIIPVILASDTNPPVVPWSLEGLNWVDFRAASSQPLKRLIWGITGQKPVELSNVLDSEKPATMQEAARLQLLPKKDGEAATHSQISKARLYPPLTDSPNRDQAVQLEILRRRVKEYWVDGVLKHSLYNEVLISLGKQQMDNAVDAPWKYKVEVSDAINPVSLKDRDVSAIYNAAGLLLILGEPGSGKSTTLLDLARTLLDRAEKDIRERVPIVLNLSNWKKRHPLVNWMADELSEKYRVPRKIARFWLQHDYLLPLLDGLDEVETLMQPDCVTAINAFIEEFNPSGLVVCCRLNEYRWLPKRLKLNGAIRLEPLSKDEVAEYFTKGGAELAGLHKAVNTDQVLEELTQTPLMLSVMSLAYQGIGYDELATQKGYSAQERRNQTFRLYVEQMFQRRGMASLAFPKEKIIGWLSWLAGKMREHSQSVFLVEGLQPSWLGTRAKRIAYGIVVALSLGLIFGLSKALDYALNEGLAHSLYLRYESSALDALTRGLSEGIKRWLIFGYVLTHGLSEGIKHGLIFGLTILVGVGLGCWSESPLKGGVMSGSIVGLIAMLISGLYEGSIYGSLYGVVVGVIVGLIVGPGVGSLNHITLVETVSWNWNQFWKRTIPGLIVGLLVGLLFGLLWEIKWVPIYGLWATWDWGLSIGLPLGLRLGLFFAPISGLVGGFTDRVKVGKAFPNQGIELSWKNSLAAFLVTWLIAGLLFGLLYWPADASPRALLGWLPYGLSFGYEVWWGPAELYSPLFGLFFGLIIGLIVGLNRGGSAVIKHYALRLILWLSGNTPFKFIRFLDHCAKLILLKKVGGGYIFIHRMLLDYFADIPTQDTSVKR